MKYNFRTTYARLPKYTIYIASTSKYENIRENCIKSK